MFRLLFVCLLELGKSNSHPDPVVLRYNSILVEVQSGEIRSQLPFPILRHSAANYMHNRVLPLYNISNDNLITPQSITNYALWFNQPPDQSSIILEQ